MSILQEQLEQALGELPAKFLANALARRLEERGHVVTSDEIGALEELMSGCRSDDERLTLLSSDDSMEGSIEITEEDVDYLRKASTNFVENTIPELVESACAQVAEDVLEDLTASWDEASAAERKEILGFRTRLYERWSGPFEDLRLLILLARELGADANDALRASPHAGQTPYLVEVFTRLHARACQVADEILYLLEGGYADGAMASWRTLHELAVFGSFICERGELVAERFANYEIVESLRAAHQYAEHQEKLQLDPLPAAELAELEKAVAEAKLKFGPSFAKRNGWAGGLFGPSAPTFEEIERAVGIDHLRPFYKLASQRVHADAKGIFFPLGHLGEQAVLLTGPSNIGFVEPGHCTALSLTQVTANLVRMTPTADVNVSLRMMMALQARIGEGLAEAHRKIEEAEAALQAESNNQSAT